MQLINSSKPRCSVGHILRLTPTFYIDLVWSLELWSYQDPYTVIVATTSRKMGAIWMIVKMCYLRYETPCLHDLQRFQYSFQSAMDMMCSYGGWDET